VLDVPFIIKIGPFSAILLFDFDIIMLLKMHYKTMLQSMFNKINLYCARFQWCGRIHFRQASKSIPDAKRL